MTHQASFAQAKFAAKKKTTRREKLLARMELRVMRIIFNELHQFAAFDVFPPAE